MKPDPAAVRGPSDGKPVDTKRETAVSVVPGADARAALATRREPMGLLDSLAPHLAEPIPLAQQDRAVRAAIARTFHGFSPNALLLAWIDWASHLAASPGKQAELVNKAMRKWWRLVLFSLEAVAQRNPEPSIEPLPQDHRFDHPAWQQWPYNFIYQAFLLQQQWWWNATSGVVGVTRHHEQVMTFLARQALDMVSPSNFIVTNPEVLQKTVETGGMNLLEGSFNWWRDFAGQLAGRRPDGASDWQVGRNVAVTPGKVILRAPLFELIQYAPTTEDVYAEPVLIVPSWIMKYYILDLQPQSSMIKYLVDQGHTVFTMSWRNPDLRDRDLGMEDFIKDGVLEAINAVKRAMPERKLHTAGYCLGGTFLAIAAAVMARDHRDGVASMTMFAAEVDYEEPGELSLFIDESQLAYLGDLTWQQGYLDGKQMAGAFQALNSKDLVWSKMVHEYLMGARTPLSDLMAWNQDATRMPQRLHSEYLRALYLENALTGGRFLVDGRPVALTDIRVPIFAVGTNRDHVSPWPSVYKIHLFTDTEVTFLLTSGGHNVGIVNPPGDPKGRWYQVAKRDAHDRYIDPETWTATTPKQPGSWWPAWQQWLAWQSSAKRVPPPPMGNPDAGLVPLDDAPGRYVLVP
jgi:polyhydroxyalkanoate synthase